MSAYSKWTDYAQNLVKQGLKSKVIKQVKPERIGGVSGFLDNLNLGHKTTALTGLAVFGVATSVEGSKAIWDTKMEELKGRAEYVGNDPASYYDAAPNVDRRTGDKTLGATGELVFGLHKGRKGG